MNLVITAFMQNTNLTDNQIIRLGIKLSQLDKTVINVIEIFCQFENLKTKPPLSTQLKNNWKKLNNKTPRNCKPTVIIYNLNRIIVYQKLLLEHVIVITSVYCYIKIRTIMLLYNKTIRKLWFIQIEMSASLSRLDLSQ